MMGGAEPRDLAAQELVCSTLGICGEPASELLEAHAMRCDAKQPWWRQEGECR